MEDEDLPFIINEIYQDDSFELASIIAMSKEGTRKHGSGSRKGRAPNLRRDFESAHKQIFEGSGMAQWLYVAVTQGPERRFEFSEG